MAAPNRSNRSRENKPSHCSVPDRTRTSIPRSSISGFGGGKTHTLMALSHLAENIAKLSLGTELLPAAGAHPRCTCDMESTWPFPCLQFIPPHHRRQDALRLPLTVDQIGRRPYLPRRNRRLDAGTTTGGSSVAGNGRGGERFSPARVRSCPSWIATSSTGYSWPARSGPAAAECR